MVEALRVAEVGIASTKHSTSVIDLTEGLTDAEMVEALRVAELSAVTGNTPLYIDLTTLSPDANSPTSPEPIPASPPITPRVTFAPTSEERVYRLDDTPASVATTPSRSRAAMVPLLHPLPKLPRALRREWREIAYAEDMGPLEHQLLKVALLGLNSQLNVANIIDSSGDSEETFMNAFTTLGRMIALVRQHRRGAGSSSAS